MVKLNNFERFGRMCANKIFAALAVLAPEQKSLLVV